MRFLLLFSPLLLFSYILDIKIDNIKSNKGYIYISIYNIPNNFLNRKLAYKNIVLKAKKNIINYEINLKKGVYAITVFHDENSNGILDRNFFHFPKEGYGFSTNPFLFGKPKFNDAEFPLKENQTIEISINY